MYYFPQNASLKKTSIIFISLLLFNVVTNAGSLIDYRIVELFTNNTSSSKIFRILLESISTDDEALIIYKTIENISADEKELETFKDIDTEKCLKLEDFIKEYNLYEIKHGNKDFFRTQGIIENSKREEIISLLYNLFIMSRIYNTTFYTEEATKAIAKILNSAQYKVLLRAILDETSRLFNIN